MLLIWLGVKVVSWIVQHKKYTYLVFGEYGRCHLLCPQGLGVLPAGNGDRKWQELQSGAGMGAGLSLPQGAPEGELNAGTTTGVQQGGEEKLNVSLHVEYAPGHLCGKLRCVRLFFGVLLLIFYLSSPFRIWSFSCICLELWWGSARHSVTPKVEFSSVASLNFCLEMEKTFPKSCSQPAPLEGSSSLPKEQSQLAGEGAGKEKINAQPILHYI